jgi:hypothetical protein
LISSIFVSESAVAKKKQHTGLYFAKETNLSRDLQKSLFGATIGTSAENVQKDWQN